MNIVIVASDDLWIKNLKERINQSILEAHIDGFTDPVLAAKHLCGHLADIVFAEEKLRMNMKAEQFVSLVKDYNPDVGVSVISVDGGTLEYSDR